MSIIATTLEGFMLGKPVVHENLAMFPLLGGSGGEPPYRTLREALDAGAVEVTEVSEGGSVPRLALVNRGDKPVLIVDGEELVGAKQNRILNITILAPAGKTTVLPVSCVEQGRWSYRSKTFEDRDRMLFHKARAAKAAHVSESRMCRGSSDSDQGEVWNHIADKMCAMDVSSPSSAMEDIYTRHAPRVDAFVRAIRPAEGQAGAVFAVNGRVEGIEAFAYDATMASLLPKLVRGYAIDAIEVHRGPVAAPPAAKVAALLRQAAEAPVASFPAAGLGEDLRFRSSTISGGALAADGALLHLCAFRLARQGGRRADDDGGTIRRRRGGQDQTLI
jgi:hypothetical protein